MSERLAQWPQLIAAASVACIAAVGVAAYGFSLRLPLFLDDLIHFGWLRTHSLGDIWQSVQWLSYYRPVQSTIWKVLWLIQGSIDAPALHAVNVALHALNGVLVFALSQIRSAKPHTWQTYASSFAAAVLFLLYPFSYQAVPWIGALAHPLALSAILAAVCLGLLSAARNSRGLLLGSLLFTIAAPFCHETGVLVAPLLTLVILTDESAGASLMHVAFRTAVRRTRFHWLWSAAGAFILLLMHPPSSNSGAGILNLETRYQNFAYFLQGLAYPVAPLAKLVHSSGLGLDDLQSIVLVCLPIVVALAFALCAAGCTRRVVCSMGWFAICALPTWLILGFDYVIDGPRLLYQASIGAALFWSTPFLARWHSRRAFVIGQSLAAATVIGIAAGSLTFLLERTQIYQQVQRAAAQLATEVPPDDGRAVMLVNFFEWLAPHQNRFPVGHEGVTIVPRYADVFDFFWLNAGRTIRIESVVIEDVKRPWRYTYAPIGTVRSAEDVQARLRDVASTMFTDISTDSVVIYDAGGLDSVNTPRADDFVAAYDNKLALVTGTYELQDSLLKTNLVWQSWGRLPAETNTFIHIQKPNGELVAQTDGFPVANIARPSYWLPGDQWRDSRLVPLPNDIQPGVYTIRVGAYPVAGGPRLPARGPRGERFDNDSVSIGQITIH